MSTSTCDAQNNPSDTVDRTEPKHHLFFRDTLLKNIVMRTPFPGVLRLQRRLSDYAGVDLLSEIAVLIAEERDPTKGVFTLLLVDHPVLRKGHGVDPFQPTPSGEFLLQKWGPSWPDVTAVYRDRPVVRAWTLQPTGLVDGALDIDLLPAMGFDRPTEYYESVDVHYYDGWQRLRPSDRQVRDLYEFLKRAEEAKRLEEYRRAALMRLVSSISTALTEKRDPAENQRQKSSADVLDAAHDDDLDEVHGEAHADHTGPHDRPLPDLLSALAGWLPVRKEHVRAFWGLGIKNPEFRRDMRIAMSAFRREMFRGDSRCAERESNLLLRVLMLNGVMPLVEEAVHQFSSCSLKISKR